LRFGESGHRLWSERSGKEIAVLDAGKPGLELFHFGIIFLQFISSTFKHSVS
jgi:hypothetical protein